MRSTSSGSNDLDALRPPRGSAPNRLLFAVNMRPCLRQIPFAAFYPAALLATLALGVGCGSKYPTLKFTSVDQTKVLRQPFGLTAMARDPQGDDYDLVMMSQGLERLRPEEAGEPIGPSKEAPVRQVVYIRIHWRPRPGSRANNPAAANASVRWIIFGTPGEGGDDLIEYQGTAFVRPDFGRTGYTLRIRKGDLRLARRQGEMTDVLGPTDFEGDFFVKDDPYTVASVLKELPPAAVVAPPPKPPTMGAVTRAATQHAAGSR